MRFATTLAATCLLVASIAAQAGQPCPEQPVRREQEVRTLQLATKVREALEQSGASIAYIGRAGIDLREYGLVFSHVGLAWRDHPRGRWFTFHLLNPCGTERSELLDQALEDFYRVDLFDYKALVAIPSPDVQVKVLKTFFSPLAPTLHHPVYNMISHPFSTRYQNSNQWVLEMTAAALAPEASVQNRLQAQSWLRDHSFVPTRVHIGFGKRLGAQLFSPHVHFDDHSTEEERTELYDVVTVEAIMQLLARQDPGLVQRVVSLD